MTTMTADEFLAHHGVKGMKWGKRKGSTSSVATSDDHDSARALSKKSAKELSNKELKTLNSRLQLEKSYKELSTKPHVLSKGKKLAAAALGTAGMAVSAYNMAQSPAAKAAIKLGKNMVYNSQYSMGLIPRAIGS